MEFKTHRLAVIIFPTRGGAYQVNLTEGESQMVSDLVKQMHNGTVKALPKRLALSLIKPKKNLPATKR